MLDHAPASLSVVNDKDLRRQIDRSVSRALVDGDYERLLLTDPTVVLDDRGCAPQHYLSLRSIQADSLLDFARQAQALFWAVAPPSTSSSSSRAHLGRKGHSLEEEPITLPAAAVARTG